MPEQPPRTDAAPRRRRAAAWTAAALALLAAALASRDLRLAFDWLTPGRPGGERVEGKKRERLLASGRVMTQLGLGLMLESEGDANGALQRYRKARGRASPTDDGGCWREPYLSHAYALSARILLDRRRLDEARRTLDEGARRCPGEPLLVLERAELDLALGDRAQADSELKALTASLRAAPDGPPLSREIVEGLGRELLKKGADPRTLSEFARKVEVWANAGRGSAVAADLYALLGDARLRLGQNALARAAFARALALTPREAPRCRALRRSLWRADARAALDGAGAAARLDALRRLAVLSRDDESVLLLPEAERLRRLASAREQDSAAASAPIAADYWRGERAFSAADAPQARTAFAQLLAREPGSIAGLAGLERVCAYGGEPLRALWYFERAERVVGHDYYPILHDPLGRISAQLRRGVPDAALKPLIYGLTALMPEYTDVLWTTYAGMLLERGHPEQARAAALFAQAHARPEHHPDWTLLVLAGAAAVRDERPAAWSYLRQAEALRPDSLKSLCIRMEFDRVDGRPQDARRTAARLRALSARADDPGLRSLMLRLADPAPASSPAEIRAVVKDGLDCGLALP